MNPKDFDKIVEQRRARIVAILTAKGKEYATDADRLHNFKVSAAFAGTTPVYECWAFNRKHLVSIMDMVNAQNQGKRFTSAQWDEKIGDAINYLILLEALLKESIDAQGK